MSFDLFGEGGDRVIPHQAWGSNLSSVNEANYEVGNWLNVPYGLMRGAARGVAGVSRIAAGLLPESAWNPTYTDPVKNWLYDNADYIEKELVTDLSPNPATVGLASQILGGGFEMAGGLAVGGPAGLAITSSVNTGTSLVDSGVDATTATVAGIGTGVANALMMAIPGAGETLKGTAALMTANPLVGMGQRYATQQGLESAGYTEQAKQFDPFDPAAMGMDAAFSLLGVPGYLGKRGTRVAKAEVAKMQTHWQEIQDALPVEVVDSAHVMGTWFKALETNPHNDTVRGAVEVHLAAMDKALSDLQAGKPVDIGREVKSLFGPDYATPTAEAFRGMLRDVWGQNEEQTDTALALANGFANYKGIHLDDWINKYIAGGEARDPIGRAVLYQGTIKNIDGINHIDMPAQSKIERGVKIVSLLDPLQAEPLFDTTKIATAEAVRIGEEYYRNVLEPEPVSAPAFNGEHVRFTELGIMHLKGEHERTLSPENIARRLKLLPAVKELLATTPFIDEMRPDPAGTTYSLLGIAKDGTVLRVAVQEVETGGKVFLTVFDWKDVTKKMKQHPPSVAASVSPGRGVDGAPPLADSISIPKPDGNNNPLFQGDRGAVSFLNDGRAILHALKNPDPSTVVHELFHIFRRQLDPEDMSVLVEFYADPGGKWSRVAEEKVARAGETYVSTGKAPSEALQGVFDKYKTWLTDIYRDIVGSPLEGQIPNRVRDVFDKMLTRERTPEEVAYQKAAAEVLAEENAARSTQHAAPKGGDLRGQEEERRQGLLNEEPGTVGAINQSPLQPDRPPNDWYPSDDVPDLTPPSQRLAGAGKAKAAETIEQAIIRLGGINRDQADSQWGATLSEGQRARMYKKTGLPIDRITEALAEEGFLPLDENGKPEVGALEDALARSLAGEDIFSTSVTDRQLDSRAAADEADYLRRQGPGEQMTDAEYEALAARIQAEDNADPLSRHVNSIMEQRGDFPLYTETTADNQQRTVTAREALESAQRDIDSAKKSRDVYEAAANCMWMSNS